MKLTLPHIQEQFRPIATAVFRQLNRQGTYTYGTKDEIIQLLIDMSKLDNLAKGKYPLIALVGNVPVVCGDPTCYGEGTFNFVLANVTEQKYTSEERIKNVFETILRPMAAAFIEELCESNIFDIPDKRILSYNIEEKLNYGRTQLVAENQTSNDFIDVIEITNLKIKIKKIK